jgi:hypothetical protein
LGDLAGSCSQTPSVGIYGHVLAGWGVFNAQPFVLNERQVGVEVKGLPFDVRDNRIPIPHQ